MNKMTHKKILFWLLAALMSLTSCNSNSDYEYTLYSDTAITGFTLGTLNRYINGTKYTLKGSEYAMQINPYAKTVENVDSLPIGTDVAHVVCTVSSMNNGGIIIKNLTDDNFVTYSSTDSIDFSQPRLFRIWASDGTGYADYTVKVNVHQQDGNLFVWNQITDATTIESFRKANDPTLPTGIQQLLGKSTYEEYALSTDGKIMKRTTGTAEWTQDLPDDHQDIANLPASDLALTCYPMPLADSTDCVILVGTKDGKGVVWRKLVDNSGKTAKGNWVYMGRDNETVKLLPVQTGRSIIRYNEDILLFGSDYTKFYKSRDNGINWEPTKYLTVPSGLNTAAVKITMTVDENQYIWVYCQGVTSDEDQLWRTRQNKNGWAVK